MYVFSSYRLKQSLHLRFSFSYPLNNKKSCCAISNKFSFFYSSKEFFLAFEFIRWFIILFAPVKILLLGCLRYAECLIFHSILLPIFYYNITFIKSKYLLLDKL